jgi:hypothetical protein
MSKMDSDEDVPVRKTNNPKVNDLPGYPSYVPDDDIFNKYQEEKDINPEDISKNKDRNENTGIKDVQDLTKGASKSDLDIPGSELDDDMEEIGSEDEENNYYSLGGDDHNDLDENLG